MSFIQYATTHNKIAITTPRDSISLKIPISTDSFFILENSNEYKVYTIRSGQLLHKGEIPKEFVASQYIQPLEVCKEKCIFLVNSQFTICRLNYQNNHLEMHRIQIANKIDNLGPYTIDFKILDQIGEYLLGFVKNVQNMSMTIFIYDLVTKTYSNFINLGSGFFNVVMSNLSTKFNTWNIKQERRVQDVNFVVVSEQDKKICYSYILIQPIQQKNLSPNQKRLNFCLKQSGKRYIGYEHCPRAVYLINPYFYVISNCKQGPIALQINLQQNSSRKFQLQLKAEKEKGIVRSYLGVVDQNLLFTLHNISKRCIEVFKISVQDFKNFIPNTKSIKCSQLNRIIKNSQESRDARNYNIKRSLDGSCYQRYLFELETLSKELKSLNFQDRIEVQIIFRIPKKYFYQEMAEQLQFPILLTNEIISLL